MVPRSTLGRMAAAFSVPTITAILGQPVNDGLTDRTVSTLLVVNEDTVFAGTLAGGIFRTMDGGDSWVETNTGLTNTTVGELAVIGKTIYAGMGERLVHSVNGGKSWLPAKFHQGRMNIYFPRYPFRAENFT